MNQKLAKRVARRLTVLQVPGCDQGDPLGRILQQWFEHGGQLVVIDRPKGKWVAIGGLLPVFVVER